MTLKAALLAPIERRYDAIVGEGLAFHDAQPETSFATQYD